jgi:purine-binding chemotaxis protein CheW
MKRTAARTKSLDWEQVRQRLAQAALEDGSRLSPERARAVLEERARLLARVPAQTARSGEIVEVITFSVAGERYAVAVRHVREVVRHTEPTPVPGTPDFLAGVVNLRGEIVAVFDLRPFFGLLGSEEVSPSRILVLGGDRIEFGVLADAVHEVLPLRIEDVLPPPDTVGGPGREYLRGVTADMLVVLDGERLLQDRRLFIDVGEEPPSVRRGEKP